MCVYGQTCTHYIQSAPPPLRQLTMDLESVLNQIDRPFFLVEICDLCSAKSYVLFGGVQQTAITESLARSRSSETLLNIVLDGGPVCGTHTFLVNFLPCSEDRGLNFEPREVRVHLSQAHLLPTQLTAARPGWPIRHDGHCKLLGATFGPADCCPRKLLSQCMEPAALALYARTIPPDSLLFAEQTHADLQRCLGHAFTSQVTAAPG